MSVPFSEVMSRLPLRRFQIVTFIICMVVLIADGMDAQLLGVVAPKIIEEFGVDRSTFGFAMSAALIGFGIGSWSGGWLGDKVGRRWSLALAAIIFSLGTVAASISDGVWHMAAWRIIGGIGFGAAYSNAITLASEWLPARWRSVGVTTMSVGTPAGGMVVAALVPTVLEMWGWRGSFVFVGLLTFLVVILVVAFLRDSPSFLMAKGRVDEAKQAARKVTDEELDLGAETHMTDTAGGSIGVLDRSNLRLNVGIGLAFTSATMVAYGILNWTTTLLTARGFTLDQAAYAVSVAGLTSIAASIAAGLLVQRFGSRIVMASISATLFISLVILAFVVETLAEAPSSSERMLVVVLVGISACIFSGGIASIYAIMTHAYPPSCRAGGIGFGIFMGRIGAIGSSGLGGWLLDLGAGSAIPFFSLLCVGAVLVSAAAFVVDRHVPPSRLAK